MSPTPPTSPSRPRSPQGMHAPHVGASSQHASPAQGAGSEAAAGSTGRRRPASAIDPSLSPRPSQQRRLGSPQPRAAIPQRTAASSHLSTFQPSRMAQDDEIQPVLSHAASASAVDPIIQGVLEQFDAQLAHSLGAEQDGVQPVAQESHEAPLAQLPMTPPRQAYLAGVPAALDTMPALGQGPLPAQGQPSTPQLIARLQANIEGMTDRGNKSRSKTALATIQRSIQAALAALTSQERQAFSQQGIALQGRTLTPLLEQGLQRATQALEGLGEQDMSAFDRAQLMAVVIREELGLVHLVDRDGQHVMRTLGNAETPQTQPLNAQRLGQTEALGDAPNFQKTQAGTVGGQLGHLAALAAAQHCGLDAADTQRLHAMTTQNTVRDFQLRLHQLGQRHGPQAIALVHKLWDPAWTTAQASSIDAAGQPKTRNTSPSNHRDAFLHAMMLLPQRNAEGASLMPQLIAAAGDPAALAALCQHIEVTEKTALAQIKFSLPTQLHHALRRLQGLPYALLQQDANPIDCYAGAPPANTARLWLQSLAQHPVASAGSAGLSPAQDDEIQPVLSHAASESASAVDPIIQGVLEQFDAQLAHSLGAEQDGVQPAAQESHEAPLAQLPMTPPRQAHLPGVPAALDTMPALGQGTLPAQGLPGTPQPSRSDSQVLLPPSMYAPAIASSGYVGASLAQDDEIQPVLSHAASASASASASAVDPIIQGVLEQFDAQLAHSLGAEQDGVQPVAQESHEAPLAQLPMTPPRQAHLPGVPAALDTMPALGQGPLPAQGQPSTPQLIARLQEKIDDTAGSAKSMRKTALATIQRSIQAALDALTSQERQAFSQQGIALQGRTLTPLLEQGLQRAEQALEGLGEQDMSAFDRAQLMAAVVREELGAVPLVDRDDQHVMRTLGNADTPQTPQTQPLNAQRLGQTVALGDASPAQKSQAGSVGGQLGHLAALAAAQHCGLDAADTQRLHAMTTQHTVRNFQRRLHQLGQRHGPQAMALVYKLWDPTWTTAQASSIDAEGQPKMRNIVPLNHRDGFLHAMMLLPQRNAEGASLMPQLIAAAGDTAALAALCDHIAHTTRAALGEIHENQPAQLHHALRRLQGLPYAPQQNANPIDSYAGAPPANTAYLWLQNLAP